MTIQQAISIIERVDICCNQAETARNMALEALREKAERENPEPLTLEELRQMEGEPVWIEHYNGGEWITVHWDYVDHIATAYKAELRMEEYGERWTAYRNRPKEAE